MNTIIEFRANKDKWKTSPTTFGWDSILLLEDTPDRIVILGRDYGNDDIYMPWKNQQYLTYHGVDIEVFHEEIAIGNYDCIGIMEPEETTEKLRALLDPEGEG